MAYEVIAMAYPMKRSLLWRPVLGGFILCWNAGCVLPSAVEEDYGKSVKQLVYVQTYDKATANNPSLQPVMGMDGQLNENVMKQYREYIANPKETSRNAIIFNVGGAGGGGGGQ